MFTVEILPNGLCPPPNYLQNIEFKGLTCKIFRNMDLSLIFGLNSRFGAVWGEDSLLHPALVLIR